MFFNLNYDNTPLLNLVRSLAAWFTPSASELSSPRVHARTAAEGQRMLARLMLQMWLFQLHLGRRLYESVAVTRFSQRSTQHGIITVMGTRQSATNPNKTNAIRFVLSLNFLCLGFFLQPSCTTSCV